MKHLIVSTILNDNTIGSQKFYSLSDENYGKVIDILNDHCIFEAGTEIGEDSNIKTFREVEIGDIAYHESCTSIFDKYEGPIIWKGNTIELREQYPHFYEELLKSNGYDYNDCRVWVIVDYPVYGKVLCNYNCDPSGVKVFKTK